MNAATVDATLKMHIKQMRAHLDQAARVAKAAEAWAHGSNIEKGIEIARDIEQILCEVATFLNAVGMIHRIRQQT